jgi:predicted dehydrogenase
MSANRNDRGTDRRAFLKSTAAAMAAGAVVAPVALSQAAPSAAETVRLALIGCGGRGRGLAGSFAGLANVEFAYVCDPDTGRAGSTAASLGGKPQAVKDLRRVLDDKSIDAVIVATPDHWHTPAALLAIEAGKHVYVEKPCSHNLREGRLLVDLARRNKRLVQHGTQSRSDALVQRGIQLLRDGAIGDVLVAKAWNVQRRGPIGKAKPSDPPAGVDYDLWIGPAPLVPYQSNRFHYSWHWWYAFGTGDTGNDGVHELDVARWGLGVQTHPSTISAVGGKFAFDDDQQFPDTQYAAFEYPGDGTPGQRRQLVFEMRLWSRYGLEGADNGNAFYGTKGWMLLSKRGILQVYDEQNRTVPAKVDLPEPRSHYQNFVDTIRGEAELAAEIEVGHLSASLCHLANISTRVGRSLRFDPQREQIAGDDEADALLSREYRDHFARPA